MKSKRSILIIGYFGYNTNQLDGQTIKSRNILTLLKDKNINVDYYDTQSFRNNPFSIIEMIFKVTKCKTLIIIPARNNLKTIFPIVFFMSKLFSFDIVNVAVGGWLDKFCLENKVIMSMLKKIKVILLQNSEVVESLTKNLGFSNADYLNNYRITDFKPNYNSNDVKPPLRIVFMARIHKMKGLDVVFSIADHYKKLTSKPIVIDFYGQMFEEHKTYFETNIAKYDFVCYYGELQPKDIYKTLNRYDLLILPTRFPTEGFPGSVLDAYISGIPVLVSNWEHAREFVKDEYNGFIRDVDNVQGYIDVIDYLRSNSEKLITLKENAFESSEKYSSEAAWNILKKYL